MPLQEESASQAASVTAAVFKSAPPVAVTGANFIFGLTLNDWVAVATLIYIGLQAIFLVKDRFKKRGRR